MKPLKALKVALHGVFWFSYAVALFAFFEQCLDNGSPIFSSVLGMPFLHHGYYGFIGIAIAYAVYMIAQIYIKNKSSEFISLDRVIDDDCPFAENYTNQEGWFTTPNGGLVCLDWDEYCTKCRVDDSKDYTFTVTKK